ncbi:chromosomal replication initiator protein DnaA [bacterium]|nr:chromosomal replication initiator protein DnaA [bacterium]
MWKKILEELKKTENENLIKTFISPLYPMQESRDEIVLCCRSSIAYDFLNKNKYLNKITSIAQTLFEQNTKVKIIIKQDDDDEKIQTNITFEEDEKKEKPAEKTEKNISFEDNFRGYTFDNFVSGPSNITVYNAAKTIAKNPGSDYNPFFVYGDSGLGKTHIVKAIGNYIRENRKKSVYYSTANQLMNEYVKSIENKTVPEFRENIIKKDVLLIDDIQFLSGKTGTQDEFFYIFNTFYNKNKQIVITSDKYISEIKDIDDRLKTRFSMGVSLDIKPPEYETRVAIIKKKSELYGIKISDEAVDLIASNIRNNIREIEGALKTLKISFCFIGKEIIDRDFAKNILKSFIKKDKTAGIDDIIKIVAGNTFIKPSEITSKKRTKQISMSRQIAMYISRKYTSKTLEEIGESFGGRDHSTVKNSIDNVEKLIYEDTNIKKLVEKIEHEIESNNSNL